MLATAGVQVEDHRGLDARSFSDDRCVVAGVTVQQVIALASQLSEDERQIVADVIARKESVAQPGLAELWAAEVERRAERVRGGGASGGLADEVFAHIEARLEQR